MKINNENTRTEQTTERKQKKRKKKKKKKNICFAVIMPCGETTEKCHKLKILNGTRIAFTEILKFFNSCKLYIQYSGGWSLYKKKTFQIFFYVF